MTYSSYSTTQYLPPYYTYYMQFIQYNTLSTSVYYTQFTQYNTVPTSMCLKCPPHGSVTLTEKVPLVGGEWQSLDIALRISLQEDAAKCLVVPMEGSSLQCVVHWVEG